jgi:hypothetical protein
VAVFYRLNHPLSWRLETLRELNLGRCIAGYLDVLPLYIVSFEKFTRHNFPALLATHFVGDHKERAVSEVQTSMYSVLAPRELLTVTARYAASMIFYTDDFLIDGWAGQGLHFTGLERWRGPAGIFITELTGLFVTLQHIGVVIQPPEKCLILTDSFEFS